MFSIPKIIVERRLKRWTMGNIEQALTMIDKLPPVARQSTPVLITIHPDGFVEVFGQKDVHAFIVNVPATGNKHGEILAEEFIALNIPLRHREIYAPGMVRAAKLGRVITPAEIQKTQINLAMLRALDVQSFAGAKEAAKW